MTQNASMVLTGRAALEASGAVSAEDEIAIGGFERIMGPNGEAQYYARSLGRRLSHPLRALPLQLRRARRARDRGCFATRDDPPSFDRDQPDLDRATRIGLTTVGEIFDDETNPGPQAALRDARRDGGR